jgi:signal transduction histidine kinase
MNQNCYDTSKVMPRALGGRYTKPGKYLLEGEHIFRKAKSFGIHTSNESFCVTRGISVFQINEQLVQPEYLLYLVIQNNDIFKQFHSIIFCMTMPVVIENYELQKEIVNDKKIDYLEETEEERTADAQRLGIKQNVSDLEHMLGMPRHKIEESLYILEHTSPDAADYAQEIAKELQSLRDNFNYLDRVIEFNNSLIQSCYLSDTPQDFSEFMQHYVAGWHNYGGHFFDLTLVDNLGENKQVCFDETRITLMLDALLNNAARHGFQKKYSPGNVVEIRLSAVRYDNQPYVLIRVANNGDPMAEGFTINKYITRGRFSAKSGRSGLGGYHVYQVAKCHHGYLYLGRDETWNMIVEILLPLEENPAQQLSEYEHGESCI